MVQNKSGTNNNNIKNNNNNNHNNTNNNNNNNNNNINNLKVYCEGAIFSEPQKKNSEKEHVFTIVASTKLCRKCTVLHVFLRTCPKLTEQLFHGTFLDVCDAKPNGALTQWCSLAL